MSSADPILNSYSKIELEQEWLAFSLDSENVELSIKPMIRVATPIHIQKAC